MKRSLVWGLGSGIAALILAEVSLRMFWGLGDPPLYISDAEFEYIYAPNQDLVRFGNRVYVNAFSMRSRELNETDSIRILVIGDSIVNGGAQTSHDNLASTLLEEQLSAALGHLVRVLNISAGSWGPDNAAAYLRRYGDFGAVAIVMVFSSQDRFDSMTHVPVVGVDPSFPGEKPLTAIGEVLCRYLLPRLARHAQPRKPFPISDELNPGWLELTSFARERGIPLLAVLHPDLKEVSAGSYNEDGQVILALLDNLGVEALAELNNGLSALMYRDDIHYNAAGQRKLAEEVYPWLYARIAMITEKKR